MNKPHKKKRAKLSSLQKKNVGVSGDNKRSILKAVDLIQETLKRSAESKEADIVMKQEKNDLLKQQLELQQAVEKRKQEYENFDAERKRLETFHKLKNEYGYSYQRIKTMMPQLAYLCDKDEAANAAENNVN